jgi:(E)-4-hydroxy-3-methyl-but-2-enyl pyrophosphate reductase
VLVAPRGYCAGVDRAVEAVEVALGRWGPQIYVRKQIVHNRHVVLALEQRGAIFVESEEDVPVGARVVFSAHGVSPAVCEQARARRLATIDATCPLVAKVHAEPRHYAARGYSTILVGHAGHEEVEGITGEATEHVLLVETVEDGRARRASTGGPGRLPYPVDPIARRHGGGDRGAAPPLPRDRGAGPGGHLLRDDEPTARREGDAG